MDHNLPSRRTVLAALAATPLSGLLAACSSGSASGSKAGTVRVGYFPNLTHAPALVADQRGLFTKRLGDQGAHYAPRSFNAGPDVVQAILSNSLDIAYIGPNPTITAYTQSHGDGVRVIAGSTSGGASLVVRPARASIAQLKGAKLATPQLGNTQDVALRYWLQGHGLATTTTGGGDVAIIPQPSAGAVQAFIAGSIDGGWLPEPYATKLVKAGGVVLVDERTLWPGKQFVTTNIIARPQVLASNAPLARAFLDAPLDALSLIASQASTAQAAVGSATQALTGQSISPSLVAASWSKLGFTADPLAATLRTSADHAAAVGLLSKRPSDNFAKLWDLTVLNQALTARGRTAISA